MAKQYFADKTAVIDQGAKIGDGTKVWHFSHISKGAQVGKNCNIGQNVFIGGRAKIGDGVKIQNNVSVYDGVILEDNVFCGPSMVFTNDMNPRSAFPKHGAYLETLVKRGASIGANVTIVCGTVIGDHAFIGAGSVVTKDIPDHALAYGNPARVNGWVCECGEWLKFKTNKTTCKCGRAYTLKNKQVTKVK